MNYSDQIVALGRTIDIFHRLISQPETFHSEESISLLQTEKKNLYLHLEQIFKASGGLAATSICLTLVEDFLPELEGERTYYYRREVARIRRYLYHPTPPYRICSMGDNGQPGSSGFVNALQELMFAVASIESSKDWEGHCTDCCISIVQAWSEAVWGKKHPDLFVELRKSMVLRDDLIASRRYDSDGLATEYSKWQTLLGLFRDRLPLN